jgi:hypothetical protein
MMVDFADATSQIEHRGSKGRERESLVVKTFLDQYLPSIVRSVHGAEILDSLGERSAECDIVVTDPSTPPLYIGETFQLIPVEWAYGLIEVKSKLDSTELADAHRKISRAKSLQKLTFAPPTGDIAMHTSAYGRLFDYFPTYGFVFAYTGIQIESLCDQLWELQKDEPIENWVDAVVVLDQGMLLYTEASDFSAHRDRPEPGSALYVVKSDNALVPTMLTIQTAFSSAWMRPARLGAYLGSEPWGNVVHTAGP